MAPLRRIQRKASGALPPSSDYPSESQADQRSVTSHPFRRRPRKRCRVEFLPSSGLLLVSAPEKAALCGWAKQGRKPGGQFQGQTTGWGRCSVPQYWGWGLFSIFSHSRKVIYFLMALALSHEAGTLSFKGTESSLLPHLAGITARQQPQACSLAALQQPSRGLSFTLLQASDIQGRGPDYCSCKV